MLRAFSVSIGLAVVLLSSLRVRAEVQGPPKAAAQKAPGFQVATIKPSRPDEPLRVQIVGRRFSAGGASLIDLLKYAYGVHASQITGAPDWMASERFDVLADPDTEERPASDEMKRMVQELVAERFRLRFHHARKELPVFAIVVAKNGPKLTKSTRDAKSIPSVGYKASGSFSAGNAAMADFAAFLQRFVVDRPVVDQTGLMGRYDVTLNWMPDGFQLNGHPRAEDPDAPPGLYTAIEEQLGLRLKATRAVIDVMVVDGVERPSEN